MPQNAIIRANGTGDYTTIIAWEAAEQSSDYGTITVGRVDGFFDAGASQTIISGTWPNGARLEPFDPADAFDGTERSLCGLTSTASITLRNTGKKVEFEGLEVYNTGTGRAYSNTTSGGDLSFTLGLAKSDTGDAVNNNSSVGVGFVDSVVVSENGNPHRDGVFNRCNIFGNTAAALGTGATNSTSNTVTVNNSTGACYRNSVTQSNNASSDATADTLDNIVIADNFESATPVASGDYRIKAGSDLDTNGIGAFIQGGSGISVTVTEVLNSFTDTSNINIDYNVSAIITETLNSFGDTSVISVTSGQVVNLTVTETLSAFTDVSNINVSANIELLVTEVLNSFLDGANVTIAKDITLQVTEVFNSFADNSSVRLPANWVDKIKVTTTYTTQTPVSTTWINKG